MVAFFVEGEPVQQGSLIARLVRSGGKVRAVLHSHASARLKAWRARVAAAATETGARIEGPVHVTARFYRTKPRTTKYPTRPAGTPDLDKLVRAVLDGLTTSGVYADDARVCSIYTTKDWAPEGTAPGVHLEVRPL